MGRSIENNGLATLLQMSETELLIRYYGVNKIEYHKTQFSCKNDVHQPTNQPTKNNNYLDLPVLNIINILYNVKVKSTRSSRHNLIILTTSRPKVPENRYLHKRSP